MSYTDYPAGASLGSVEVHERADHPHVGYMVGADIEKHGSSSDPHPNWLAGGGGGIPNIGSIRIFGMSHTGDFDDPLGETGWPNRLAGMLGVSAWGMENFGIFGSSIMDIGPRAIGVDGYLHETCKPEAHNTWPWIVEHGVDFTNWSVNDLGTRFITGLTWPEQGTMWRAVWQHAYRSLIQRSIAGGTWPAARYPDGTRHPTIIFSGTNGLGQNQGGYNGSWVWVITDAATGAGYWKTSAVGDRVNITVPANYDTGAVAFHHWFPGSYYTGAPAYYDRLGTNYGSLGLIPTSRGPGAVLYPTEVPQAATVSIAAAGATTIVRDGKIMKNRESTPGGVGIAAPGMMACVDRMVLPPTPGTPIAVTITVTACPAGGFYGFDSWDVEAKQVSRPPGPVLCNVALPTRWAKLYSLGVDTWAAMDAMAAAFSADLAAVAAEWGDPGICVADIAAAIAAYPVAYSSLYPVGVTPATDPPLPLGPGAGSDPMEGDGTHPHDIGARLIAGACRKALVDAGLDDYRYANLFSADRDVTRI